MCRKLLHIFYHVPFSFLSQKYAKLLNNIVRITVCYLILKNNHAGGPETILTLFGLINRVQLHWKRT